MKKSLVIHPFIFALLPIISLYSYNLNDLPSIDVFRSFLIIVMSTCILLLILRTILKNFEQAGIICSFFLILFFSYGHVYNGLIHPIPLKFFSTLGFVGQHTIIATVWIAFFAFGLFVSFRLKNFAHQITYFLNIISCIALIIPISTISRHEWLIRHPINNQFALLQESKHQSPNSYKKNPDIYYIILDGYAREDILDEYYQFDNSDFICFLAQKGFILATDSKANYLQTSLSIASSLNLNYLENLSSNFDSRTSDRLYATRLIQWNYVLPFLEKRGYRTFAYGSGYRATELVRAQEFHRPKKTSINWFEKLVIDTSALVLLQDFGLRFGTKWVQPGYDAHRQTIDFILNDLSKIVDLYGPKFIFVHIIAPHPPFVFNTQGNPVEPKYPFTLMDGDAFPGNLEEYKSGYRSQLSYINGRIMRVVEDILTKSTEPPIIIIQGDHGPGSQFSWSSLEPEGIRERSPILNAYFLPGANHIIYDQITPVNTFRVVFNQYFGTQLPLLPDKSYFSTWDNPFLFYDVDSIIENSK